MTTPYTGAWNAPSPNSRSWRAPEVTPSSTGVEMFGRINILQSENSVYNSSRGNQINVRGSRPDRAAPAVNPNLRTVQHHSIFEQAAEVTRAILHGMQGWLANEDGFARLAKHACNLIDSAIAERDQLELAGRELAPGVATNLAELVGKLRPIAEFVNVPKSNVDAGKVDENRERFRTALVEFEVAPPGYSY